MKNREESLFYFSKVKVTTEFIENELTLQGIISKLNIY